MSLSAERTIFIQIGPELRIPAVLECGANQVSLIPRPVLDRLVKAGWDRMRLEKLAHPILIKLGDNTSTVEVWETVTLDLEILRQAGQLPVRNRRFLVWNVPGDEAIVDSDILQALGINPYHAVNG